MKYPDFLQKNGTIGLIAPSFGCAAEPYRTALKHAVIRFTQKGYRVAVGPNCYLNEGVGISNRPSLCAKEFNEAYTDGESAVLLSCGGGELMCEILDAIDFEAIRHAAPKWFMGYSDNTNLVFLLTTLCDTAAVLGPNAAAFGMHRLHPSLSDALKLLTGRRKTFEGYPMWELESLKSETAPLVPYNLTMPSVPRVYVRGGKQNAEEISETVLEGRLLGGCLDILENLAGTRFDGTEEFVENYQEDGILWFLESCDLTPMGVRRAIWRLKHCGWFHNVKGFLIGRPLRYGEEMLGLTMDQAVLEPLLEYQVPVVLDMDIGHHPPMLPIVSGSLAVVTVKDHQVRIRYRFH